MINLAQSMHTDTERNQAKPPSFRKTKSLLIGLFAIAVGMYAPLVAQDTLGVAYLTTGDGGPCSSTQADIRFTLLGPECPGYCSALSILVSTNDIGRIFPITQAQNTNFIEFVSKLTNGTNNYFGYMAGADGCGWVLGAIPEKTFVPPTENGVDLQGHSIDNIAFQIDALTFHTTPTWTDMSVSFRILVNAKPVPGFAPTMVAPLASQTIELGSQFSLRAQVEGVVPVWYWWLFEGTNAVSVATTNATVTLTNAQFSQSGAYSVIVSNSFGCITSPPALLNVIPPVQRRVVPALVLNSQPGSAVNLDFTPTLRPVPQWTTFQSVPINQAPQWYFDISTPLPPLGFYRAWHTNAASPPPVLNLNMVPALTLTGAIGNSVRIDCISQYGPIDAWTNLATVTLTNTSQIYFDTSSIGQPPRLWRVVPMP